MTAYVMGAGASLDAHYPLGRHLLRVLDTWMCGQRDGSPILRYKEQFDAIKMWFPALDDCEQILRTLDADLSDTSPAPARRACELHS
jgi:hypothetical protein